MAEISIVWTSVTVGGLMALPLSISIALWSDYRRKLAAAMAAPQEPDGASEETVPTDVLWAGDKVYYTDVPAEEVEHRIREVLNRRRLERSSKNDVLNVV